jgi:ferredoxin
LYDAASAKKEPDQAGSAVSAEMGTGRGSLIDCTELQLGRECMRSVPAAVPERSVVPPIAMVVMFSLGTAIDRVTCTGRCALCEHVCTRLAVTIV